MLFWALDRFSREGVLPTLTHLQRLEGYGVAWRSYTEQYLDSTGDLQGRRGLDHGDHRQAGERAPIRTHHRHALKAQRPGVINGLRLQLRFPAIPIPGNCETIKPTYEIRMEDAKHIDENRFEWINKIVLGGWMPFTVLPKTTVTKHFVFESRWEHPVIQDFATCTLEIKETGTWHKVTSWQLSLAPTIWSQLADIGGGISYIPEGNESIEPACVPADLHKYTGTRAQIPKGGLGGGDSYLDFPMDDEPEKT